MSKASEKVYEDIRAWILDGSFPPGMQVTEEDLARQCNVSRTPVREAIQRLQGERFIERDRQRSYVRVWSNEAMEDVFAIRAMLEPYIAERAAERIDDEGIAQLDACNAMFRAEIEKASPDYGVIINQNTRFHSIMLEAAQSEVLELLMRRILMIPIVHQTLQRYDTPHLRRSWQDHEETVEAFRSRNGAWARAIMQSHLQRARHVFFDLDEA